MLSSCLLYSLLVGTLNLSKNALRAVNAYGEIIAAIDDADNAASMALNASTQADQQVSVIQSLIDWISCPTEVDMNFFT